MDNDEIDEFLDFDYSPKGGDVVKEMSLVGVRGIGSSGLSASSDARELSVRGL